MSETLIRPSRLGVLVWALKNAVSTTAKGISVADSRAVALVGDGGSPTSSGERVTVNSALQLATVWACVRLIAQTLATLPLMTYRRDKEGFGALARGHWLFALLHDSPNADMTAVEFWECMVGCLLLWGNAYAQLVWSGPRVVSIMPMRPDRVQLRRESDGSLTFVYVFMGQKTELAERDVFHLKGFSLDGMVGLSAVAQGRQSIGTAAAAERAAGSFFRNGMRPSSVLTAPVYLTAEQRKRKDEWLEDYTGAINNGRVPLLEGGWKLETLAIPPEDAQLLSTRQFDVEELCRWFDVPPVMIGHTQSATAWGSGLEQLNLWFLAYCLRPHLRRIEARINKQLVPPGDRSTLYAEFNVEGLLRSDSKSRAQYYAAMVDHGLKTRNEVRAKENDPPMDGAGDLTVNAALLPLQLLGEFVRGKQDKPLQPGFVNPTGVTEAGGTSAAEGTSTGD